MFQDTDTLPQDETLDSAPGADELHAQDVLDDEADRQAAKDALVPKGSYLTSPPLAVTRVTDEKQDNRIVYLLSGRGVHRETGQEETLRFRMSHQRRDNIRKPGKPDSTHLRYLDARKIVEQGTGEKPKTMAEIVNYLASYPIIVRMGQFVTEDGEAMEYVQRLAVPKDI